MGTSRPGLTTPYVEAQVEHGYYVYTMKYDASVTGVARSDELVQALQAEACRWRWLCAAGLSATVLSTAVLHLVVTDFPFNIAYQGALDWRTSAQLPSCPHNKCFTAIWSPALTPAVMDVCAAQRL